jgi:hypothetical protein
VEMTNEYTEAVRKKVIWAIENMDLAPMTCREILHRRLHTLQYERSLEDKKFETFKSKMRVAE